MVPGKKHIYMRYKIIANNSHPSSQLPDFCHLPTRGGGDVGCQQGIIQISYITTLVTI